MESCLVNLIDDGSLSGRIDSSHKVLYAKFRNSREEVMKRWAALSFFTSS
jgi:hypothetical protein